MTNLEKVNEFLDKAHIFYFLTTDGDQPRGRPFGLRILDGDRLYFGCGTFKNVFKQLTDNPKVEVLALAGGEFMRYDGIATVVKDPAVLDMVRKARPEIMEMYDKNGWEMGVFCLENGHAQFRDMMTTVEEFDI